ncbi:MAG: hypothetical protein ACK4ND_09195 [Cytophagaceae bacterium]
MILRLQTLDNIAGNELKTEEGNKSERKEYILRNLLTPEACERFALR